MYSLNRAEIIGNLTKDPEIRQFQSGSEMASFSVATNYTYKDQTGEKHDKPEYHNIVVFGRLVDIVRKYLHKGNKVYIDGRIQTRSWEGKDGSKRYSTEIVLLSLIILTPKKDNDESSRYQNDDLENDGAGRMEAEAQSKEAELDDLPF